MLQYNILYHKNSLKLLASDKIGFSAKENINMKTYIDER